MDYLPATTTKKASVWIGYTEYLLESTIIWMRYQLDMWNTGQNSYRQRVGRQYGRRVRIAVANVGTIKDKVEEIVDMMVERNIDILGPSEMRCKG